MIVSWFDNSQGSWLNFGKPQPLPTMKCISLFLAGLIGFQLGANAVPYVINLTSMGDGYRHDENGSSFDYWDGTSDTNRVHYQFYGTSDNRFTQTAYLQFNLSALPATAAVNTATLNLYVTEIHYGDDSPSGGFIRHASNSSAANGDASQRLSGDVDVIELKDQPPGWLSINVTSMIQSDIDNGFSYAAFSGTPNTTGYFRYAGFSFTSADAPANQPCLEVTTVPEPATVCLLLGLAALVAVTRRSPAG